MWSSLAAVVEWAEGRLGVRTGTYPPADAAGDFAVVQRVGGDVSYPHDSPRYAVQVWAGNEPECEQVMLALARMLPTIRDGNPRINGVGTPSLVSLGRDEGGRYVWQLEFELHCNIKD